MLTLNDLLLILHLFGLMLGFSASVANLVVGSLIAAAEPSERPVLGRVPPKMSHVASTGLVLMWVTGVIMLLTKWDGGAGLPWPFHAKLTAVVLLTLAVGYGHSLQAKVNRGDTAAAAKLPNAGKVITLLAVLSVIFAVMTFG
jgi:hypothetical protein